MSILYCCISNYNKDFHHSIIGIELLRDLTYADVKGLAIGSTEIEFSPKTIKQGNYLADTKTAGSIALLLQCALPVALFSDGHITLDLRGGTNCDMAPQVTTEKLYLLDKIYSKFSIFRSTQ